MQEFAWTEQELLSKIKARASSLPEVHKERIMMEPMFVMESVIAVAQAVLRITVGECNSA